jgi:hypothetical protein
VSAAAEIAADQLPKRRMIAAVDGQPPTSRPCWLVGDVPWSS